MNASRDLGARIEVDSEDNAPLVNGDEATHRSISFLPEAGGNFSLFGQLPQLFNAVKAPSATTAPPTNETLHENNPPTMTDAEGFISPDGLLAHAPGNTPKALFSTIVALICKQCDCYIEHHEGNNAWRVAVSHFSPSHMSLDFELRLWQVLDCKQCKRLLPDCPDASLTYVFEFKKLMGDNFRWRSLFIEMAKLALECQPTQFFVPTRYLSRLNSVSRLEDARSNSAVMPCETGDGGPASLDDILRTLRTSTLEGQQAAATALVLHCVTEATCLQLAESEFLDVARTIFAESSRQKVPQQHSPLLRCVLLLISTAATSSIAFKSKVAKDDSVCAFCVDNFNACDSDIALKTESARLIVELMNVNRGLYGALVFPPGGSGAPSNNGRHQHKPLQILVQKMRLSPK